MNLVKLYTRFIIVYMKSKMEYRFAFFMDLFTNILTYSLLFGGMWILLNKFNMIHGWNFYEVMFLYNINLFTYALSGMFIKHPMLDIETMVQSGTFDSILVKPINPLFHVVARQFEYTFFGHVILSIVVFGICIPHLDIVWSMAHVVWFVLFTIGAVLIHSAFMIMSGSISFWFVKSTMVVEMAIYDMRSFLNYPIAIYAKWVQVALTFIFPFAFINFYPTQYFLRKDGSTLFHPYLQYGTPIVGLIAIFIAYRIWCLGLARYESTGS